MTAATADVERPPRLEDPEEAARIVAELTRRNADLAALNQLAGLAVGAADLPSLFARAEAILREAAGCAGLAFFVLDEAERVLLRVHAPAGAPDDPRAARVPLASPLGAVLRDPSPRLVTTDDGDALALPSCRTAVWVPLVARSKVVGVMGAGFPAAPEAVRPRLDLLAAAGAHLAGAVESHGLLADLRRRVAELTLLNDVALATGQLDPVLLLDNALRRIRETFQADTAAAYLREGDRLVLVASSGVASETASRCAQLGVGEGLAGLAVQRLGPVQWDEASLRLGASVSAAMGVAEGLQSAIAVPLLAKGQAAVGAVVFGRRRPHATSDGEVTLLSAVGVQLGVAVENARLFADVRRRLSDLEAVHALALRIFGNAPGDVQGLLDDGCREAARALRCRAAAVLLAKDDTPGARLRGVAGWGVPFDSSRVDLLAHDQLAAEAIRRRAPAWCEDVTKDPRSAMHGDAQVPPLALLVVPLTSRAATRGVLCLADDAGRAFTEAELALANALAGELAVGLENAELYAEARQRLSELSTVIDVARVVSSSLELEEVLALGAQHLRRTLAGSACTILLDDVRHAELRRAASSGPPIGPAAIALSEGSLAREALHARAPVAGRTPAVDAPGARASPASLAIPLHVRDQPVGVALVTAAEAERTFTPAELSRAMAIASQLAVAVDNARLYSETRRRAEELGLLHEVGRSLVATLDIERVLDAGVRNLARIVDAPVALLALLGEDGAQLEIRAVWGMTAERVGQRQPLHSTGARLASLVHDRREPIVIEDAATDPRVRDDRVDDGGARALLGLPLLVRDRYIGTAVIVEPRGPRRFSPAEVERAAAIANQLAVAAENARLYEDLRRSYAELAQAQRQLIQQERLAALGELAAVVAHEVRNPLGVIFNSLGSLRRLLRPHGDAKMLLDILGEEADRLNRIVGDLLDFARPSTPLVRPESLERVVDEAVAAALAQHSTAIALHRETGDLPLVSLDARLVRQAVLNVAVNAVQAMPRGGALTVRTRREERSALVEVEDSGAGIPDEVRSRIFEPFFTTKASGTGLGLAVVKRIVEGHGGEISVRSRPGAGTTISLRFPLAPGGARGAIEIEDGNG